MASKTTSQQFGLSVNLRLTILKITFLAVVNSVIGYMAYVAFLAQSPLIGFTLVAIAVVIIFFFSTKKFVAAKFLVPGTILLVLFTLIPVIYTQVMSLYNYKTGNLITKDEAVVQVINSGLTQDELGLTYDMLLGEKDGKKAAVITDQEAGTSQLVFETGVPQELETGSIPDGFIALSEVEVSELGDAIADYKFNIGDGYFAVPQATNVAAKMRQIYEFDAVSNTLTDVSTGETYIDNGNGNFALESDKSVLLYPGWRELNPLGNYFALISNPDIRGPFLGVFAWTIFFSVSTVISMFAVGLILAIALDKRIRFRPMYRSILILPYAIPSFMSILIWAGMFNREYGAVNLLVGSEIPWLDDPTLAKIVILIVNLWLGFPYFYLISSGALQALPSELDEAAAIDGASPMQTMFQIKLPLLLQILAPLLIGSVAFNFNNFNIVYLLTAGGPTNVLEGEVAGATDILITYTYKTAFAGGEQDLGLASAISVIMFLIVGALSIWSLRRSRVLEEQN
jgi:arabinogalactan oligomer/maltooligosaccharide transport system permease protein